jgi:hypothetical protein
MREYPCRNYYDKNNRRRNTLCNECCWIDHANVKDGEEKGKVKETHENQKGRKKEMLTKAQEKATKHANKLGAGAKARKKLQGKEKIPVVMHEFKNKTLHSGSGQIVTNPKQALAIALSEAGMSKKKKHPRKKVSKKK